jgi:hypothetical protein
MQSGPRSYTRIDYAEGFRALEKAAQPFAFLRGKRKIAELEPARVAHGEGSFLGFVLCGLNHIFAENEPCLCRARMIPLRYGVSLLLGGELLTRE